MLTIVKNKEGCKIIYTDIMSFYVERGIICGVFPDENEVELLDCGTNATANDTLQITVLDNGGGLVVNLYDVDLNK